MRSLAEKRACVSSAEGAPSNEMTYWGEREGEGEREREKIKNKRRLRGMEQGGI